MNWKSFVKQFNFKNHYSVFVGDYRLPMSISGVHKFPIFHPDFKPMIITQKARKPCEHLITFRKNTLFNQIVHQKKAEVVSALINALIKL